MRSEDVGQEQPTVVNASGARGIQIGDGNVTFNTFTLPTPRDIQWPVRIGFIPIAAACLQTRDEADTARALLGSSGGEDTPTVLLFGLGGVGKTQLASAIAREAFGNADLVIWANASSKASIRDAYQQAATLLGFTADTRDQLANQFLAYLSDLRDRSWLLVLDDIVEPADVRGLLPYGETGAVLATSRRSDALGLGRGNAIQVGVFTESQAHSYLIQKLGVPPDSARLVEAEQLAVDLGHLPLALGQAAAYMSLRPTSTLGTCQGYRQALASKRRDLNDLFPEDAPADDYAGTVAATWSISIDAADELHPQSYARRTLNLLSMLSPDGIPLRILDTASILAFLGPGEATTQPDDEFARISVDNLARYSLLSVTETESVRLHALVQRVTRQNIPIDQLPTITTHAADALLEVWPEIERNLTLTGQLQNCATSLLENSGDLLWKPRQHIIIWRVGESLGQQGQFLAAAEYWRDVSLRAKDLLGIPHPNTFVARMNAARWKAKSGNTSSVVGDFEELVRDAVEHLGSDSSHTLNYRHDLAYWRAFCGDIVRGLAELDEVLRDRILRDGPFHLEALRTRGQIARIHMQYGDPSVALPLLERLVTDCTMTLGPQARDTLITRMALGNCLGEAGQPAEAVKYLQNLVTEFELALGPQHRGTFAARGNLARWVASTQNPADAVADLSQLVREKVATLGADNPETLTTRHNLACLRGEAGDINGAISELEKLELDRIRIHGHTHPGTIVTQAQLARWREVAAQ